MEAKANAVCLGRVESEQTTPQRGSEAHHMYDVVHERALSAEKMRDKERHLY